MEWDRALFDAINGLAGRWSLLDQSMTALGNPSSLLFPGLLLLGYWVWQRRTEALIGAPALAVLIVVADFLGAQIKHWVARPRPCQAFAHVHEVVGCGGTFSFPSNHAVNTAAAAAFFQTLYPSSGWVSWPLVVLIGMSRVYIGGHFVTDVIGGWMIGGALGAGTALLLLRWSRFRPEP